MNFFLAVTSLLVSSRTACGFDMTAAIQAIGNLARQSRVVGGTVVSKGRHDYLALTAGPKLCGATLIHKDILLTAGHCAEFFDEGVFLGGVRLSGSDGELHGVEYVYSHEEYPGSGAEPHDIALVKLSAPSSIEPVKLATESDQPGEGDTLTVLGWGATSEDGPLSNTLLEANLDVSSFQYCNGLFGGKLIEELMFCTLSEPGTTRDSCQGDSGGPLVNGNGVQEGIVFFGSGCARENTPSVNTRVSGYRQWIAEGICAHSDYAPDSCTSELPSKSPTLSPSSSPTYSPTTLSLLTGSPSSIPSYSPVTATVAPTATATEVPTATSILPTTYPSIRPTTSPTGQPVEANAGTPTPTGTPTLANTSNPSHSPAAVPTSSPTPAPTPAPTVAPTSNPSPAPTPAPTTKPTLAPTLPPTKKPTGFPTRAPSASPVAQTSSPTSSPPRVTKPICSTSGSGSYFARWRRFILCILRSFRVSFRWY